jgi:hypothetical protein
MIDITIILLILLYIIHLNNSHIERFGGKKKKGGLGKVKVKTKAVTKAAPVKAVTKAAPVKAVTNVATKVADAVPAKAIVNVATDVAEAVPAKAIVNVATDVADTVEDVSNDVANAVEDVANDVANAVKPSKGKGCKIKGIGDLAKIDQCILDLVDDIEGVVDDIAGLKSDFENIGDTIEGFAKTAVNTVFDGVPIDEVVSFFKDIPGWLKDTLGKLIACDLIYDLTGIDTGANCDTDVSVENNLKN